MQTEAEIALASVFAPGHQAETKFDVQVWRKEPLLKRAVIEYLGAASEFTEPEISLVLSPVLSVPRHDERPSRVIGEYFFSSCILGVIRTTTHSYDSDGWGCDRGVEWSARRISGDVEADCGSLGGAVLARSYSGGPYSRGASHVVSRGIPKD
jgi:hypothetical protein